VSFEYTLCNRDGKSLSCLAVFVQAACELITFYCILWVQILKIKGIRTCLDDCLLKMFPATVTLIYRF
jgi:hypothetical protein